MVNACLQPPLNDFRELMYHVAQSNLFREPVEDICNSLFRHLEKPVTLFASLLCKDGTWYTQQSTMRNKLTFQRHAWSVQSWNTHGNKQRQNEGAPPLTSKDFSRMRSEGFPFIVWGLGAGPLFASSGSSGRRRVVVASLIPCLEAAKPLLFEGFHAGCHVVLRGRCGTFVTFQPVDNVSKASKLEEVA